jgi:hypothetical protein
VIIRNLMTAAREWLRLNWVKAVLILSLGFIAGAVIAAPSVSLAVTVGAGNVPTATWTSTEVTSCAASGAWSGTKATSGTQVLSALTATSTYTLTCTAPGDTQTVLSWTAPVQNTDGTALTDLAGFRVYRGASADALAQLQQVTGAASLTYTATGLPVGTNYFAVTAYSTAGVESLFSAVGSKIATASASVSDSKTLKIPRAPVLTVQTPVAYDVQQKGIRFVLGREIGSVPVGTSCERDFELKGGYYRVKREDVDINRRPRSSVIVAHCA